MNIEEYKKELEKQFNEYLIEEKEQVSNWNGKIRKYYVYSFTKNNKYIFKYEFNTKKNMQELKDWFIKSYIKEVI